MPNETARPDQDDISAPGANAECGLHRRDRRILVIGAVLASTVGMGSLLRFPPDRYLFYPRCPVFAALHLLCPGCGSTRALAALLHGDLPTALHQNMLFVLLLPSLIGYALLCGWRAWRAERYHFPAPPQIVTYGILALAVVFTLLRNLQPSLLP